MSIENTILQQKILNWFFNGETGMSSEAMARVAVGQIADNHYPHDPDDFNRCLKLINTIPEIKNFFPQIAQISKQWKSVIDNWDIIEKTFLDEVGIDFCNGYSAPKTYHLMKSLGL